MIGGDRLGGGGGGVSECVRPLLLLLSITFSLTSCIFIGFFSFEYFDLYDHYAACWVTLSG